MNARAPDGVIEGIEDPRHRFVLGVQWHPEYEIGLGDAAQYDALSGLVLYPSRRALAQAAFRSVSGRVRKGGVGAPGPPLTRVYTLSLDR